MVCPTYNQLRLIDTLYYFSFYLFKVSRWFHIWLFIIDFFKCKQYNALTPISKGFRTKLMNSWTHEQSTLGSYFAVLLPLIAISKAIIIYYMFTILSYKKFVFEKSGMLKKSKTETWKDNINLKRQMAVLGNFN